MGLGTASKAVSKGIKKIGQFAMANPGAAKEALSFGFQVNMRTKQGDTMMGAMAKEGLEFALWARHPAIMGGVMAGQFAYHGTKAAYQFRRRRHGEVVGGLEAAAGNVIGGNYMDTNAAVTMRQAAVQQIQGNKMNARSALGGEARIFAGNAGYR